MSEFNFKQYLKEGKLIKENSFTDFEKTQPARLNKFIEELNELADEYHAELYLNDEFYKILGMMVKTVSDMGLNENKPLKENKINNSYLVKSEEHSNDFEDYYEIDEMKALKYLSQFDDDFIDAKNFIDDDEGWGEFIMYLEDKEQMTDKELEDAMKMEMSYYYFSDGDSI